MNNKKSKKVENRVNEYIKSNNFKNLGEIEGTNFVSVEDENGYRFALDRFRVGKNNPKRVGLSNPHSIENIKLWLLERYNGEYVLLSKKYNGNDKLILKCSVNHTFKIVPNLIWSQDIHCGVCGISRGEKRIKDF